jgi:hypothetical protein
MGETLALFTTTFNRSLRIESRPERLTAEPGAVLLRELLERSGILDWLTRRITDARRPEAITYPMAELLRTSVLLLAQGWRDQDDADALRQDPGLRLAMSDRRGVAPLEEEHHLPSQPTCSRLVAALSREGNASVLRHAILELAGRRLRALRGGHRRRRLTIDVDSLPIEVHGQQPGSAWNGHYHGRIYHPLIATVAETGDILDGRLRAGNAHTAEGALEFILDLVDRARRSLCQVAMVRFDAGFPGEPLLVGLEHRAVPYVARIRTNAALDRLATPHLHRPPGRPPLEPRLWLHEMRYAAKSWSTDRRVVLVVLERPGELLLDHFWLLTSLPLAAMPAAELLEHYRQRGTAEGHMGELMDVLAPALSSTPRPKEHYRNAPPRRRHQRIDGFACNEARLLLNLLAYEAVHTGRALMEAVTREGWSLRRFRDRVLRTAARVTVSGRRVTMIIGEAAAKLWHPLWRRLDKLQWCPG